MDGAGRQEATVLLFSLEGSLEKLWEEEEVQTLVTAPVSTRDEARRLLPSVTAAHMMLTG